MPTFILFKDGNKVKDVVGANPAELTVRTLFVALSVRRGLIQEFFPETCRGIMWMERRSAKRSVVVLVLCR